ncbi:MAG: hypothetical protein JSS50_05240 [Proteobacteria bacterium]|nr:hypothetical protein [Pseudomonadota bacterium]
MDHKFETFKSLFYNSSIEENLVNELVATDLGVHYLLKRDMAGLEYALERGVNADTLFKFIGTAFTDYGGGTHLRIPEKFIQFQDEYANFYVSPRSFDKSTPYVWFYQFDVAGSQKFSLGEASNLIHHYELLYQADWSYTELAKQAVHESNLNLLEFALTNGDGDTDYDAIFDTIASDYTAADKEAALYLVLPHITLSDHLY